MEKLTKLDKDISYVSSLSDYPNSNEGLTSTQLKETFDKGNNDIKDFINTTLTEEIDSKFATVPETYATKEELANVQAGQIIDGTVTYEKLSEDVQNKVKEADKVKPIYKYHKLDNPTITKENGKYINNFTLDVLPENPVDGLKFSVEFPSADEKQGGTDYYTPEGYKINATNIQDYEHGVDRAFDRNIGTSCILTSSDTIILTLPEAKTFTKIKTFITAGNLENIIYKGSNNKEEWTNLGVVSTADTELAEHTFSLSGEYLHYGIEINVTEGTATINDIQFEEDENMPSDWILGTGIGMITTDVAENRINGMEIIKPIFASTLEEYYIKNNKIENQFEDIIKKRLIAKFDKPGTFTWTPNQNTKKVSVVIQGGGGAGGVIITNYSKPTSGNCRGYAMGGGAGFVTHLLDIDVEGRQDIPIVIGEGGASASTSTGTWSTSADSSTAKGNAGGSSSFDGVIAEGGAGGTVLGYWSSTSYTVPEISGGSTAHTKGNYSFANGQCVDNSQGQGFYLKIPFDIEKTLASAGGSYTGVMVNSVPNETTIIQEGTETDFGKGGDAIVTAASTSVTGSDATGNGNGGGATMVIRLSSDTFNATSGAGSPGMVLIYA